MLRDMARMVVVASGSLAQVQCWSDCLRRASIEFVVARCDSTAQDHAELWVEQVDVDEARSTIRSATHSDRSLLW
jgi:hypothetical protein